ncbi:MAG: pyridoxal phosphate-dependent aminotransferase [Patescibacteria group bacterium]|nr:pyridoxal phosphate-dependent aminotransferase [Patescibacteria group bacterium]
MEKISQRAKKIAPSPTLSITAKAKELKKQGFDVVSLAAGEPDFDTPLHIKKAAIKAIEEGFTKYTPTSGILELKQAICQKFKKDQGLVFEPKNVLVANGGKQALANIILALVNPGDEVIIPSPYWVSYLEMVNLAEGKAVFIDAKKLKEKPAILKKAINKKTKLLILNSPSNPTGMIFKKKHLEEMAKICLEKDIYILSDEIYEKLIYGKKHYSIAQVNELVKKKTIIINGVSKTYAMTGWRIGYAVADEEIIKAASSIQDHTTSNPCSIAQKAALAALTESSDELEKMRKEYQKRRDYLYQRIEKVKGLKAEKPDGAFYLFVDVSYFYGHKIKNSVNFCQEFLEKKYVATIPGIAFGDDRFIRLSFATDIASIKKGVDRLEQFLKSC